MILGVGVDICQIDRFAAMLARRPGVLGRLLNPAEQQLAGRRRPDAGLAARFAAKEALGKALGTPAALRFLDAEVLVDEAGRPSFELRDSVADRARELGVGAVHLSLSHDGGLAIAMVVLEGQPG